MTWFVGPTGAPAPLEQGEVILTLTPTGDGAINAVNGGSPLVFKQSEAQLIGSHTPAGYWHQSVNL